MRRLVLTLLAVVAAAAQTQVDLRMQGRNGDFSAYSSTKPAKAGSVLPALCGVGEVFFKINEQPGSNLYVCSAENSWSLSGGGKALTATVATLPAACNVGEMRFATDATVSGGAFYIYLCTAANTWTQTGYVGGGTGALAANCSTFPCVIDVTDAVPLKAGVNQWAGANDFSTASKTAPFRIGTSDPLACDPASREFFFNTASNTLKSCNSLNVWTPVGAASLSGGFIDTINIVGSSDVGLYAGESPGGKVIYTGFVPAVSGTVSKIAWRATGSPGAGMAVTVGLYSANCTRLAQANVVNPSGNQVLTLSAPVSLTAGRLYFQAISAQAEFAIQGHNGTASGIFYSHTGGADTQHFVGGNTASGSGATHSLPATCGTRSGSSYYAIPVFRLFE